MTPSREQIIQDIRSAIRQKNEIGTTDAFLEEQQRQEQISQRDDLAVIFAQRYIQQGGSLAYCSNTPEIADKINELRGMLCNPTLACANANVVSFIKSLGIEDVCLGQNDTEYRMGVLLCAGMLADTGNVVLSDKLGYTTIFPSLPKCTILIAFTSQVINDWEECVGRIRESDKKPPRNLCVIPTQDNLRKQKIHLILVEDQQ